MGRFGRFGGKTTTSGRPFGPKPGPDLIFGRENGLKTGLKRPNLADFGRFRPFRPVWPVRPVWAGLGRFGPKPGVPGLGPEPCQTRPPGPGPGPYPRHARIGGPGHGSACLAGMPGTMPNRPSRTAPKFDRNRSKVGVHPWKNFQGSLPTRSRLAVAAPTWMAVRPISIYTLSLPMNF